MNRTVLSRLSPLRGDESSCLVAATWLVIIVAVTACLYPPGAAKADGSVSAGTLQVPERLLLCQPINRLSRVRLRAGAISTNAHRDGRLYERVGAMRDQCF